jgi:hypothetical protein
MVAFGILINNVCYMACFLRLVGRNFALVPRSRVLTNMVYVRHLDWQNRYLDISGHLAGALRRRELTYDQINDQAVLRSLAVNVGV